MEDMTQQSKSFMRGGTNPLVAFFGYGVVGTLLLIAVFMFAFGRLSVLLGPRHSFAILLGLYAVLVIVWGCLGVGIYRSLAKVSTTSLRYTAITVFGMLGALFLGGLFAAIVLPILRNV
jgi:O-antigen/teichoic acid export membrane protein